MPGPRSSARGFRLGPANQASKDKFLRAQSSDTLRSPTRAGKPARQPRCAWPDEWERQASPAPQPLPLPQRIAELGALL
jgi:NAD(P)H-dependent flavin oxidoreductase YrpB (nitropropane dioxygenase family)